MCDPGYLAWCSTQGIQMHHVQPGMVAEGWRGVVATAALSPGDVVMSVPEVLLMSVLSAQRDPQLGQALAHHQQQQQQQQQLSSHQVRHQVSIRRQSKPFAGMNMPREQHTSPSCLPSRVVAVAAITTIIHTTPTRTPPLLSTTGPDPAPAARGLKSCRIPLAPLHPTAAAAAQQLRALGRTGSTRTAAAVRTGGSTGSDRQGEGRLDGSSTCAAATG